MVDSAILVFYIWLGSFADFFVLFGVLSAIHLTHNKLKKKKKSDNTAGVAQNNIITTCVIRFPIFQADTDLYALHWYILWNPLPNTDRKAKWCCDLTILHISGQSELVQCWNVQRVLTARQWLPPSRPTHKSPSVRWNGTFLLYGISLRETFSGRNCYGKSSSNCSSACAKLI